MYYDEAANLVDALDLDPLRPRLFFPGNQGREPLQIYLVAIASALVGPGSLAIRLPSLLAGMVGVLATYLLAREVGGRNLGLLAALLLATSYWHVALSRMGFRAVWLPVIVAVTLALYLRAARTGSRRTAVACGLVVGLGMYTYLAARIVPLALLIAAAALVGGRTVTSRRALAALAAALAVAVIVALPLGAYFARHPELLLARVESASGGDLSAIARVAAAPGTFVWAGDPQPRHNLAERPAFDPIAGGLFLLGLTLCLTRRDLTLPLAAATMLLPQALATGEPHFLRAAGALPPAVTMAAIGLRAVLSRLPRPNVIAATLALLWLATAARDYFVAWAPSREAYQAFEGQGVDARRLVAMLPPKEPIAAGSPIYGGRGTFYLGVSRDIAAFDSAHAVVIPAGGSAVILPVSFDSPRAATPFLPEAEAGLGWWPHPTAGAPGAALFRLEPRTLVPSRTLPATFADVVALDGYHADADVSPGGRLRVDLTWRVLGPAPHGIRQFAHAIDLAGNVLAGEDAEPFPSRGWRGGELVRSWYELGLPADRPPMAFWVATGFYTTPDLRRLLVTDGAGRPAGDRALLGPFKLWRPALAVPRPVTAIAELDGIVLGSVTVPARAQPGGSLPIRLTWWAERPTAAALTVFVHLLDGAQRERAGADGPPAGGTNPTSTWQPGELVADQRTLALPTDLPPGTYDLEVGLYDGATGRRLPLHRADRRLGDAAIVATIVVR